MLPLPARPTGGRRVFVDRNDSGAQDADEEVNFPHASRQGLRIASRVDS